MTAMLRPFHKFQDFRPLGISVHTASPKRHGVTSQNAVTLNSVPVRKDSPSYDAGL